MTAPALPRKNPNAEKLAYNPLPHMDEYLQEKDAAGRKHDYIRVVKNSLTHFADFCTGEGILHPHEITRAHLIRYMAVVNTNPAWSASYRQVNLRRVKFWLAWLTSVGYIAANPWVNIKVGYSVKKPKPLEDDELALLFATHRQDAFNTTPFLFHRREMILCLLYGWGLRVHELEALNMTNFDARADAVLCKNKGGGTKSLPFSPEMKRIFQRWSAARMQFAIPGEDALIINTQGKRLNKNQISDLVAALGAKAGVAVNAHRLRDTCGTNLLDSDVPVERVMKILGHSNVKRTLEYSRVNDHKVAESHEAAMDPRLSLLFRNTGELKDE